jgi:hypothetical protein
MTTNEGGQHLGRLIDGRNPGQDASDGRGGTEPVSVHQLLRPIDLISKVLEPWAQSSLWWDTLLVHLTSFI